MMKKILTVLSIGLLFILASCRSNTPRATAERFVNAFYHRDFKTAMAVSTQKTKDQLDMISQFAAGLPEAQMEEAKKIKIKMGKEEINGDKATVYYTTSEGDLEQHVNLVKQNGKWLVEWNKMDTPAQDPTPAANPEPSDTLTWDLEDVVGDSTTISDTSSQSEK